MNNKKKSIALTSLGTVLALMVACSNPQKIKEEQYYAEGMYLYRQHCQNCHMEKGEGLGGIIPPLAGADYLAKHQQKLACIIQNGQTEEIKVNGTVYQGIMPGFKDLSPIEIAEIITYINQSWGNNGPAYSISEAEAALHDCP